MFQRYKYLIQQSNIRMKRSDIIDNKYIQNHEGLSSLNPPYALNKLHCLFCS